MKDLLVLRSAIDLLDSVTTITWSNKYICPEGYVYNDDGYVITSEARPIFKCCIGLSFGFLIGRLGMREYVRQNAITLRALNPDTHRVIVGNALYGALRKYFPNLDRKIFDEIVLEVYTLTDIPKNMDPNFMMLRHTFFRADCDYNTMAKVIRYENSIKIDSDREYMSIDKKYLTQEVATFTGFSLSRINKYWKDKQWSKQLRTLFTLGEAVEELAKKGITNPTRQQLAEVSGISVTTISRDMIEIKKMLENKDNIDVNGECEL